MQPLEIEVKFHIANMLGLRKDVISLGALREGKSFETNLRLEDPQKTLQQKRSLLRLRKDSRSRLTFKSAPVVSDDRFKIRREIEVVVDDFNRMREILEAVGFRTVQVYEKWRETFRWKNTILCLDCMPYGNFLEIEGDKDGILETAAALGLDWEDRILMNYLGMFAVIRRELALGFQDLTFHNFEGLKVDLSAFIPTFQSRPVR